MKEWINSHMYGILGTVTVHLILAILFMMLKISSLQSVKEQPIIITFEQQSQLREKPIKNNIEKIIPDNKLKKWIHDIPVNEALNKQKDFDINKYIEQVKEEMIKSGELSKNNFIDKWRKQQEEMEKGLETNLPLKKEKDTLLVSEVMASHYSGPTRVKYFLPGRIARKLIIPIYKCEGAGTVVLNITVDRTGRVTGTSVDSEKSSRNSCMLETALQAAQTSLFDVNMKAPEKQHGTITYYFVAQNE